MDRPLQLCYPVSTLDGKALLSAGAVLSTETMEKMMRSAGKPAFDALPFLAHGTIARDLDRISKNPPYSQIFSDRLRIQDVFDTMQRVELVKPLLDIYDHFRKNDPYTYRHILTVFVLSVFLAQDLFENRTELAMGLVAAHNHDLGKICVPTEVLKKKTPLNKQEQQQLGHHVAAGYVLLSYYLQDPYHPAAIIARDHHERLDGSGYPRGVIQNDRFVEIVAVCDVFDALISRRPYRSHSYDVRTALEALTRQADGGALGEETVHALIRLNRKNPQRLEECKFSKELRGNPPAGNQYKGALRCKLDEDDN
jgi:HD-GYP domain-containing protein (c-di-GMP phosphodiesterase class II)